MAATTKVSISFPAALAEEIRELAERESQGNLSALVTALVERQLMRRRSLEAVADWESEHGEFSHEELAAARRRWLD